MKRVLIVDDQETARRILGSELEDAGFEVVEAHDGEDGWRRFCESSPQVVVTDMAMPRCDGIELLRRIRSRSDVPVIVFSGHGSIERAAEAFKAGADDFVDSLALDVEDLLGRVRSSADRSVRRFAGDAFEARVVGQSPSISRVRWQLAGLAPLSTPVLVTGEVGTGRSHAIRAMHELGSTAAGRLRRLDAASFVPAEFSDPGVIEAVQLVDVERLTPAAQRYWGKRLERAEHSKLAPTLRLFASSSVSLGARIRESAFDPKLGAALLRFQIEMPPLRDRSVDVPLLAVALLERIGERVGRPRIELSAAALEYLEECRLPENIGQLERLLERAVAYTLGRVIRDETLRSVMAELERSVAGMRDAYSRRERQRLLDTLDETGGNITHTARRLGKSRAAVYRLIAKHDIALERRDP